MQYHKEQMLFDLQHLSPQELHQQLLNSQQQMLMAASSGSFRGMGSGQLSNTNSVNENNRLNMRARKERNMKFITYLRAQMM